MATGTGKPPVEMFGATTVPGEALIGTRRLQSLRAVVPVPMFLLPTIAWIEPIRPLLSNARLIRTTLRPPIRKGSHHWIGVIKPSRLVEFQFLCPGENECLYGHVIIHEAPRHHGKTGGGT